MNVLDSLLWGVLPYVVMAVLIGDTITEEALPTYESWLMLVQGMRDDRDGGWNKWVRAWTAEENRHVGRSSQLPGAEHVARRLPQG